LPCSQKSGHAPTATARSTRAATRNASGANCSTSAAWTAQGATGLDKT